MDNIQIINETEAVEIVKQPDLEIPLSIEKIEGEIQGIDESIGNFTNQITNLQTDITELQVNKAEKLTKIQTLKGLGLKTKAEVEEAKALEELQAKEILDPAEKEII